ncbi:hypothetical protein NADE_000511 [Nannochloris sp. 'desiccata']|nr:hypothetical protein KSW81_004725 [Chlorella desiccata (nom. nud.)]KAH7618316.1 hypothetical protein NADE_000511 [Chlorella desiccata (nom. nud.)]
MDETPKKGMVKQLLEWANPPVFGAAVIVAFRGFAIFQRGSWQELAAFVGLVTIVVSATKYAVDRLSKLDRVPFMLAKLHSGLKSDVKEHVDQQNLSLKTEILEHGDQQNLSLKTEILEHGDQQNLSLKTEILEHVDQQNLSLKIEILEHVDQQKTEILEHVDQQKTEILGHVDQQKTEILAAIKESKS